MSRSQKQDGRQVGAGETSELVRLGERFARFRKEHPRGARIPDELRGAALALMRRVAPTDVYRTCGIGVWQVMAWKEAAARGPMARDVRVFSVVDEEPVPRLAAALAAAPALELRLGSWTVSVRPVDPAGRG